MTKKSPISPHFTRLKWQHALKSHSPQPEHVHTLPACHHHTCLQLSWGTGWQRLLSIPLGAQPCKLQLREAGARALCLSSALRAGTFLFFLWVEAVSWMEPISGLWLSPQPLETVNLTAEQGAWLKDSRGQQADTSAWAPALSSGYPVNQSGSGSTQTLVFSSLSPSTLFEASYPWVALQRNLENASCF